MSFGRIEELVNSSPVGSNGVIFLPYLNGERTPQCDSDARGVLFGLSSFHGQGDVLRAIHEGVVFALRESRRMHPGPGYADEQCVHRRWRVVITHMVPDDRGQSWRRHLECSRGSVSYRDVTLPTSRGGGRGEGT